MNDFNLRPEVMGFGRPERVLTPAPVAVPSPKRPLTGQSKAAYNAQVYGTKPENSWVAGEAAGIEVNGLGQLRTALALPASEFEIAASMRHADAAPVARPVFKSANVEACQCEGCTGHQSPGRFAPPPASAVYRDEASYWNARYAAMSAEAFAAAGKEPAITSGQQKAYGVEAAKRDAQTRPLHDEE